MVRKSTKCKLKMKIVHSLYSRISYTSKIYDFIFWLVLFLTLLHCILCYFNCTQLAPFFRSCCFLSCFLLQHFLNTHTILYANVRLGWFNSFLGLLGSWCLLFCLFNFRLLFLLFCFFLFLLFIFTVGLALFFLFYFTT